MRRSGRNGNFLLRITEPREDRIGFGHAGREVHWNDVIVSFCLGSFKVANETSTACGRFRSHQVETMTRPKLNQSNEPRIMPLRLITGMFDTAMQWLLTSPQIVRNKRTQSKARGEFFGFKPINP